MMSNMINSNYPSSGGSGMAPRSRDRYPSPNSAGVNRHHSPGPNPPHPNTQAHPGTQAAPSVGFSRHNKDDYQEERKKYLTAKYPQHQMRLIRKRLEVEDWVDKQLRVLYNVVDDTDTYDCEIDLDDLLDLDHKSERRRFVMERLTNLRRPPDLINRFVEELLDKAATL